MSARIKANQLCYIRGVEAKEYNGRIVKAIQHHDRIESSWGWARDAWEVEVPWDIVNWAFNTQLLVPISDPDADTTETTDALHDSLVAVLAEARP